MNYLSVVETAAKWEISERRVRQYCDNQLIVGAIKKGKFWLIPDDATRPIDHRYKSIKNKIIKDEYRALLLYSDCLNQYEKLSKEEKMIMDAQILYQKGQFNESLAIAKDILLNTELESIKINCHLTIIMCAMLLGDIYNWRTSYNELKRIYNPKNKMDRDLMFASIDSSVYYSNNFPDWFIKGRFDGLSKQFVPYAIAEYIFALRVMSREGLNPRILEPLCSAIDDNEIDSISTFAHFSMAQYYHLAGFDDDAIYHIDKAMKIALPKEWLCPIADAKSLMPDLIDNYLRDKAPDLAKRIAKLSKDGLAGWNVIYSYVHHGEKRISELKERESEIAILVCFDKTYKQIADALHISVSTVKSTISSIYMKTGCKNQNELRKLLSSKLR